MPLTWFAHQAPVIPLKMAKPRWFDGSALCIGSMMPDVMYCFSSFAHIDTHHWAPALTYGTATGLLLALVIRHVIAPVGPLMLPDGGPLRLHSYAVLARRRLQPVITLVSVVVGIVTHIALDSFTHPGRWTVRKLGYDDVAVRIFGHTEPLADVLQIVAHVVGSAVAILLLWAIGRRRLLEEWYGANAVAAARAPTPTPVDRSVFWSIAALGLVLGYLWGIDTRYIVVLQRMFVGAVGASALASLLLRRRLRSACGGPSFHAAS
jgi:hypothetical protein